MQLIKLWFRQIKLNEMEWQIMNNIIVMMTGYMTEQHLWNVRSRKLLVFQFTLWLICFLRFISLWLQSHLCLKWVAHLLYHLDHSNPLLVSQNNQTMKGEGESTIVTKWSWSSRFQFNIPNNSVHQLYLVITIQKVQWSQL